MNILAVLLIIFKKKEINFLTFYIDYIHFA